MRLRIFAAVVALSIALSAQEHQHHQSADAQLGSVRFPISCKKEVRADFERAVAMLHSFWYDHAEAAFHQIATKDPDCAMAYWGTAMSLHHPLWAPASPEEVKRGAAAIEKAQQAKTATPREKAYIDALAKVYDPANASLPARNRAFADGMRKVYQENPTDIEAAIFYALAYRSTADPKDKSYAVQREVGKILDPLFRQHPQHPGLAHYVIHNYDYPALASEGLDAARRYAKIAPAAPHALHMPSHIFVRLGLWEDAIHSNTDSANAGRADFQRSGSQAALAEQLHAMDYLVYAYLQRGETKRAQAVWSELKSQKTVDWNYFNAYHAASAIPARILLEMQDWKGAAELPEPTFTGGNYWTSVASAITLWARSLGAAHTNDPERAQTAISKLEQLQQQMTTQGHDDAADGIQTLVLSAQGWSAYAKKDIDSALKALGAAADLEDKTDKHPVTPGAVLPAREQLADLLLEASKPREALQEYEASLKLAPNRLRSLAGAARASNALGDKTRAGKYRAMLKDVAPNAQITVSENR